MPAGRPCKLTPEIQKRIVTALHAGNYIETAAAYAGISKDTLYRWLKQGARSKTGVFHAFSVAVEEAMAKSEVRDVILIAKAAVQEWQAAAWRLERKYPDRWGRRERVQMEHSGEVVQANRTEYHIRIEQVLSDERARGQVRDVIRQALQQRP